MLIVGDETVVSLNPPGGMFRGEFLVVKDGVNVYTRG
ncbi:hypothetical protein HDG37_007836 [Paraburkholderia sp. MM5384-R2]|nr:hypothetical protein [Paraburkholderia sp. MM5384-R2]